MSFLNKKKKINMVERVYFLKEHDNAIVPKRSYQTDAGYDVTVIRIHKEYGNGVILYDTGISLRPHSEDIYFDLVARSSLAKKGFMLANSVGIIDNGYRGSIMVQLYKFDIDAPMLELPARVAQLIPRKMQPIVFQDDADRLKKRKKTEEHSKRGTAGFGSTDIEKK